MQRNLDFSNLEAMYLTKQSKGLTRRVPFPHSSSFNLPKIEINRKLCSIQFNPISSIVLTTTRIRRDFSIDLRKKTTKKKKSSICCYRMEIESVTMLRAAWISTILPVLIAFVPSPKLRKLRDLISVFAKRGITSQSSSNKFSVPQKFFSHFYVLGVVWTTLLLVATWIYSYRMALTGADQPPVFLLLLMEVQVLRRLFESIYVFKYSPSARMHIVGYLVGLFYYAAAPLSLCYPYVSEVLKHAIELVVKGKGGMEFSFGLSELVNPIINVEWYGWIGATIFLWGWIHQRRCHAILGSLREKKEQADDYIIPHGDWFEYVSCPHYLAEIVIYFGLVIASGGMDLNVWLVYAFVVVNLTFAAAETHKWYLQKFDNYPTDRFAIIPFIY